MNIEELDKKLKSIQDSLKEESEKNLEFAERLKNIDFDDEIQESEAKEYYYSQLDEREKNLSKEK